MIRRGLWQIEEAPLTIEGDRGDTEEPPSVAASKPPSTEDKDDLEEEPIMTAMMFRFSIPGAATNTVLGERGGTLSILKSRTGCTALTLGGEPEDKKRMVTVRVKIKVVGKNAQRPVRYLVMAQRNGVWSVYKKTLFLKYNHGWGGTTPSDPKEAKEVKKVWFITDARA